MTFEEWYKSLSEHDKNNVRFGLIPYELVWKAATEAAKPIWIPVSEMLPEIGVQVVLMADRYWNVPSDIQDMKVTATGYLSDIHGHKYWSVFGERGSELNAFTHWFELPELPE